MKVIRWNAPFNTEWHRENELDELVLNQTTGLSLLISGEEKGAWRLSFKSVAAFRVTTEECIGGFLLNLPIGGSAFEVLDSDWIHELNIGGVHFLDNVKHYIIFCYDDIIEIVALDVEIESRGSKEYN